MKDLIKTLAIVAGLVTVILVSCKKNDTKPSPVSIVGNWRLLTDSDYVDAANITAYWHTYKGTASDHYNFQSGGRLSWYENNFGSDSATYSLKSGTVTISYLPKSNPNYSNSAIPTYTITTLTTDKMVLVLQGGPEIQDIMTFSR